MMVTTERIHEYAQKLPEPLQAEVLDFIEFLLSRTKRDTIPQDERAWTGFSLAMAMRGMEDESTPHYTIADLKVVFS